MAKEIEVKVLDVDLEDMEKRLIDIGAELISKEYQINTLFDTEDKYIEDNLNSYLRIRETRDLLNEEVRINLTLKKNIGKEGARENIEISSQVKNKESMIAILKQLGYKITNEGYKDRISYMYENIRFDLDRWDESTYPYPYMEIEVEKKEDLDKAIKLLNIHKNQISLKSIMELKEEL